MLTVCQCYTVVFMTKCQHVAGGDDDAVDVSANVGRSHATAGNTEAKTSVDRQTDLLGYNSRSCQLHSNTQHTSR